MKRVKSPLRYPGGKSRAVKIIIDMIPDGTEVLMSPFIGGGSIEIMCAKLGMTVYGYDVFEPLTNFWKVLLRKPIRLSSEVQKYFPLSKEKFYEIQKIVDNPKYTSLERAAMFYVLNRSSFSGTTMSGGMSPGHPRFTQSSIDYIRDFRLSNFNVGNGDFHDTILQHTDDFMYLDPPYLIEQDNLYGKKGNTHSDFDHEGLASLLRSRSNWILSYNDCPRIRELYAGYDMSVPEWTYCMPKDKGSKELLIVSMG